MIQQAGFVVGCGFIVLAETKMKRIIYCVKWVKKQGVWYVTSGPGDICLTKKEAVKIAVKYASRDWWEGYPAQVVIYKKDGKIQEERTYGRDPRKYPG